MKVLQFIFHKFGIIKIRCYRYLMVAFFNNIKKCKISDGVVINKKSSLYNVEIGFGTYLAMRANISNAVIGKFCSIGPNLLCGFGIHPIDGISTSPTFYSTGCQNGFTLSKTDKIEETKEIIIGSDVFIGANVTVLDGVKIGDGAVIGAGSVVSKDIPPYAVAIGCPIKVVKYRFNDNVIADLLKVKWWNADLNVWKEVEENFYDVEKFLKKCESRIQANTKHLQI